MKIEILKGGRLGNHKPFRPIILCGQSRKLLDCVVPFIGTTYMHVHKYWPKAILLPQMGIIFNISHPKHIVQCAKGDVL